MNILQKYLWESIYINICKYSVTLKTVLKGFSGNIFLFQYVSKSGIKEISGKSYKRED